MARKKPEVVSNLLLEVTRIIDGGDSRFDWTLSSTKDGKEEVLISSFQLSILSSEQTYKDDKLGIVGSFWKKNGLKVSNFPSLNEDFYVWYYFMEIFDLKDCRAGFEEILAKGNCSLLLTAKKSS